MLKIESQKIVQTGSFKAQNRLVSNLREMMWKRRPVGIEDATVRIVDSYIEEGDNVRTVETV